MRKVPSPSRGRLMPWVCKCSMMIPERFKAAGTRQRRHVNGYGVEGWETAYRRFDSLPLAQSPKQDRVTMVRGLRQRLEANEQPARVVGEVGGAILFSVPLVLG